MARHGKCRCGTILRFELTQRGYKTRCPVCKAIVRLSPDDASGKKPRKRAPLVAAPNRPPPPPGDFVLDAGTDFSVLSAHEHSAPAALAEMEAYRDPQPTAAWVWWLFAGVALVAACTIIVLIALVFG
jgi:hypothetical protein